MATHYAYLNDNIVPIEQATVSVTDLGFSGGDSVYEVTRTFGHKLFRLDDHLDRLMRSLKYIGIDPGLSREEIAGVSSEIVARSTEGMEEEDDVALWHVISRGPQGQGPDTQPTVAIYTVPVDFTRFARRYTEGSVLVTPSIRRTPPESVDARAKLTSARANHMSALLEVRQVGRFAIPLMLDIRGFIAETNSSNFFFVSKGVVCTPSLRNVLAGVTRMGVLELAGKLGLQCVEGDFTLYDAYNADEAFTTGTSESIVPVKALNGRLFGSSVPGPVTFRLMLGWIETVGIDFVVQGLSRLKRDIRQDAMARWKSLRAVA